MFKIKMCLSSHSLSKRCNLIFLHFIWMFKNKVKNTNMCVYMCSYLLNGELAKINQVWAHIHARICTSHLIFKINIERKNIKLCTLLWYMNGALLNGFNLFISFLFHGQIIVEHQCICLWYLTCWSDLYVWWTIIGLANI